MGAARCRAAVPSAKQTAQRSEELSTVSWPGEPPPRGRGVHEPWLPPGAAAANWCLRLVADGFPGSRQLSCSFRLLRLRKSREEPWAGGGMGQDPLAPAPRHCIPPPPRTVPPCSGSSSSPRAGSGCGRGVWGPSHGMKARASPASPTRAPLPPNRSRAAGRPRTCHRLGTGAHDSSRHSPTMGAFLKPPTTTVTPPEAHPAAACGSPAPPGTGGPGSARGSRRGWSAGPAC